jgi:hypothetical protein
VAGSELAHATLGWQPRFDDLVTMVSHALAWERELVARRSMRLPQRGEFGRGHGRPAIVASPSAVPPDGPIDHKVSENT